MDPPRATRWPVPPVAGPRRSGFTLVELLIVVTIIGLLVGLLLPAVIGSREAGRRALCGHRLRMLGLAAAHFHTSRDRFPPGYLGPMPQAPTPPHVGQFVGSLVFLLPYLDMSVIFRAMDTDRASHRNISVLDLEHLGDSYWERTEAWRMAQYRINAFLCPSDNADLSNETFVLVHYFDRQEASGWRPVMSGASFEQSRNLGKTNYLGVGGACGRTGNRTWDRWQGIFFNRSQVNLDAVVDGASQTMLFGESIGGDSNASAAKNFAFAWAGCGTLGTYWGLNLPNWNRFGSRHPGIVQFCFADGSVRAIQEQINYDIYLALSGYQDRAPVSD